MKRKISVIIVAICIITAMTNAVVADEYATVGNTYGDRDNCVFWGSFEGVIYEASSASGLPNGLYIVQYLGDGGFYVTGTVLPGTVGTHSVTISTSGQYQNYTIVVSKGSQTICLVDNITSLSLHEDETYLLGAYSIDVSGNVINVSSVDSSLVAEHQPTYTYSSSDTSVATVSEDGVVTGVGNGSATITISSAETGSYLAATPISITVTSTAHTPTDSGTVVAPTCTEQGYTRYYCTTCESYYYRSYTEATGHTAGEAVVENEVLATCTEDGSYDSVVYCSVCEAEISRESVTVSATGHSYESVVTSPTCTEGGYTTYTCACGDSYTADETEATGHTAGEAVVENEVLATCTEDGSYDSVVYCSVCNTEISRETVTVEATGHTCVDGVCSVCGAVTAVTIDGEHALAEVLPSGLVSSVTVSVDLGEISVGTVDGEHKLEAIADAMGFTLYNDSHGEWLLKNTEEFLIRENSRIRKVTAIFYGDIDFDSGATVTMSFETTSSALSSATIHVVHYENGSWKEETSTSTYQEGTLTVTFQPDSSSPFLVLAVTDYNSSSRDNPLPLLLQIGALNQSTSDEPTEEVTEEVVEIDEPVEAGNTDAE